jgi:penicillin-binding protein 1A
MRSAVKDRPAEKFDTEVKLPEWRLEPDDEFLYGDPDDYYYVDEQGNLVEPGGPNLPRGNAFPSEGATGAAGNSRDTGPLVPVNPARPAVNEDFLERAIGGSNRPANQNQGQASPLTPVD